MEQKKINKNPLQRHIFSFLKPSDQLKISLVSKAYLNVFCSLYSIDPSQFFSFLQYLHLFFELKKLDPQSEYCNFPNEIDLYRIISPKDGDKNTVHMAVAFFLNSVSLKSYKYMLYISSENELQAQINIIRHLSAAEKYSYVIRGEESDLSRNSLFELSKLLSKYTPVNYFDKVTEYCINSFIPHSLYFVDLDTIPIDKAIEYSIKFPNRIQRLQCNNEKESKDKLNQLALLNNISLVQLPNPFFELYSSCKNIKHVSFLGNDTISIPDDFDCSKVETLDTVGFNEETLDHLIKIIGKFPNLKHLLFSTWCPFQNDSFFFFFNAVKAPNLTRLQFEAQFLNDDANFDFILQRFPKLACFEIEEHESMDFSYKFSPVFSCEKTQMSMECLEKLIRNYLIKDYKTLSLTLSQKSEDEVLDYFTSKKEIMNKVKQVYFYGPSNKLIDHVKTLTINSNEIRGDFKHVDHLVIEIDINQHDVINFVKKVNPIILDINKEEDNLAEHPFLKDIPSLKFILMKGVLKYVKKDNAFIKLE